MQNFVSADYYDTLGIEKSSSQDEIKKAYRKRVMTCHPDRHPNDKKAEEEFKKVSEAYGILGDPERRKHYDLVSGLIGSGPHADDAVNGFVEAFGEIINNVRRDFEKSESNRKKNTTKKRRKKTKNSVKKDDEQFVTLRQGKMTFKVRRRQTG